MKETYDPGEHPVETTIALSESSSNSCSGLEAESGQVETVIHEFMTHHIWNDS